MLCGLAYSDGCFLCRGILVFLQSGCRHVFPFPIQDSETMSCAEITVLNLIDYFSVSAGQPSNNGWEVHFNFSSKLDIKI